jgi:hypothetical protein
MRMLRSLVLMAAIVACAPSPSGIAPLISGGYQDIPSGFDFPAAESELLRFRDAEDVEQQRRHAWMVWAGLTQTTPGGEAIWETWYSAEETFDPAANAQALEDRPIQRRFRAPRQFEPEPGAAPQAIGDSLLSFVLFNRSAHSHIRGNRFYLRSTLTALESQFDAANAPIADRHIADFPADAVSLKTTWWPVAGTGLTPMPVWDNRPMHSDVQGNPFPTWERVVLVDPARPQVPENETAPADFSGRHFDAARVVPLQSLYYFRLDTDEQVTAVNDLIVNSVRPVDYALGRDAMIGDYIALVAFHYTTREIPDWVWGTFWWHDRPNDGSYAAHRPQEVAGVWRNYLMDVAYSTETPREESGAANAVYNPWLEARFSRGLASNCMTCHERSVWRDGKRAQFLPVTVGGMDPDDPYFSGAMRLDLMWSLGFEAQPDPPPQ